MDGLTLSIINGNKKALALAKTLVTTPTLINIDPSQGALYAIPIEAETNQKNGSAEVSESLVISKESKQFISDNVAPGSKSWRLSGYIKGVPTLEPTTFFQPFVQMHTDILWNWFDHGAVLVYRDGNAQIHNRVVIKDLQTSQQKDCANATPVTITLKEINVMESSLVDAVDAVSGDLKRALKSIPELGTIASVPITLGMTATEVVESFDEEQAQSA